MRQITEIQYLEFINFWLDQGIDCVQLREKNVKFDDLLKFGGKIKNLVDLYRIPLIINDSVELCLALEADGVHLGQTDGDITEARAKIGETKILGLSTNNLDQVKIANFLPIDYIGVGAIFASKNKLDLEKIWGIENLKIAVNTSQHPVIAIGGINFSNAKKILACGASGFAAIEAFWQNRLFNP